MPSLKKSRKQDVEGWAGWACSPGRTSKERREELKKDTSRWACCAAGKITLQGGHPPPPCGGCLRGRWLRYPLPCAELRREVAAHATGILHTLLLCTLQHTGHGFVVSLLSRGGRRRRTLPVKAVLSTAAMGCLKGLGPCTPEAEAHLCLCREEERHLGLPVCQVSVYFSCGSCCTTHLHGERRNCLLCAEGR